ncbi:MAG: hypothetical protein WCK32_02625 [Chlorobiaceae bacterium]
MTIVLLIAVVILLLVVLVLLLTGWPGRELKEIEQIGRELRRDLAQNRADYLQFLHTMRIELENSLSEAIEQQLDSFKAQQSRFPVRRQKSSSGPPEILSDSSLRSVIGNADELPKGKQSQYIGSGIVSDAGAEECQLSLFSENVICPEPEKLTVIQISAEDDLPDIDDL